MTKQTRETVADSERPVMLFSVGKDSSVRLHLACKAFDPSVPPFPLLHVDTTWKFRDIYEMREKMAAESGMKLLVHQNPECLRLGSIRRPVLNCGLIPQSRARSRRLNR